MENLESVYWPVPAGSFFFKRRPFIFFAPVFLFCVIVFTPSLGRSQATTCYTIVVAQDGTGNYTDVQQAFNAVPNNSATRTVIFVKNGTYQQAPLTLASNKINVTLIGQSPTGTILSYGNYNGKVDPSSGITFGTGNSASFFMNAAGFYATNISFQNSAGPVGQALAINIGGDKAVFNNCNFLGRQDTIYGNTCRQYFQNCYIEGTTDFIFGPSTAVFQSCHLHSYGGTALTAASTNSYVPYGYVFLNCNVTAQTTSIKTDLGRPWRPYAAVAYLNCNLGSVINPPGWDDWSNTANDSTARFSEYQDTSTNAVNRVPWSSQLTAAQAALYTPLNVLSTTNANPPVVDNWNPFNVMNSVPPTCVPSSTMTPLSATATPTRTFTALPPTNTKTHTPAPPTMTFTATPTKTNTPVPATSTFTFTPTRTHTPVPPTATFTSTSTSSATPTKTNTPVPPTSTFTSASTSTATPTKTNSPMPPTASFTSTATSSATSTKTNSPVPPTSTNTMVPPTSTLTSTPMPPTATNTSVPPSATFTHSPVPPTSTNTSVPPTATSTAVPPTNTSTPTAVPPTSTNTPVPPTSTNTAVPPTSTSTQTPAPPTVTNTPVPATFTHTPVPPTATNTATPTKTNSPVPPTSTNTAVPSTATFSPTDTLTPVPATSTSTHTPVPPTATLTPTSSFTSTQTATLTPTQASGIQAVIYPNPVSGGTFNLQITGMTATDKVQVQLVTTVFRAVNQLTFHGEGPGTVTLTIPATDASGVRLANGVYYVIVRTQGARLALKLLVLG